MNVMDQKSGEVKAWKIMGENQRERKLFENRFEAKQKTEWQGDGLDERANKKRNEEKYK